MQKTFSKEEEEQIQRSLVRLQQHRRDALALLGVAHFNYNGIVRSREMVTEYENDQILGVVKRLLSPEVEASDIAMLAHMLVMKNRTMAQSLETFIGLEIEDLMRKEDADEI